MTATGQILILAFPVALLSMAGGARADASFEELTQCAALFQARSVWTGKSGDNLRVASEFGQRAANLTIHAFGTYPKTDPCIL